MLILFAAVLLCAGYLLWQFMTDDLLPGAEQNADIPETRVIDSPPVWMLKTSDATPPTDAEEGSRGIPATSASGSVGPELVAVRRVEAEK